MSKEFGLEVCSDVYFDKMYSLIKSGKDSYKQDAYEMARALCKSFPEIESSVLAFIEYIDGIIYEYGVKKVDVGIRSSVVALKESFVDMLLKKAESLYKEKEFEKVFLLITGIAKKYPSLSWDLAEVIFIINCFKERLEDSAK